VLVLGAFLVGYYLGAKSDQPVEELVDSVKAIVTSEEFRTFAAGAFGMASELVRTVTSDGRVAEAAERVAGRGLRAV
jgi:hypothetical protein